MDTLEFSTWVKAPLGYIRRECLPSDHPESIYQVIKNKGLKPEDYNVYDDKTKLIRDDLSHLTKEELIDKCAELTLILNKLEW